MKEKKCCAGCNHYEGGEARHLKECDFYSESLTRINDIRIAELTNLVKSARKLLKFEHDEDMEYWREWLRKSEKILKKEY